MPLVKIYLRKGKTQQYLKAIGDGVHEALVSRANAPADDRFQVFHELEPAQMIAHPTYAGANRSEDLVIVEISLNVGRTTEVKKQLYAGIVENLGKAPGVRPDDVLISLVEVNRENWSFAKGIATYA